MTIESTLLELLRCPADGSAVELAADDLLTALNARILKGGVTTLGGEAVERPITSGVVRTDGTRLYPIADGIPVMLVSQAIPLVT